LTSRLGVCFLDKIEAVIDYHSITRVLDLLWVAVGLAINIYIIKEGISFSKIINGKNDKYIYLKVYNLFL